MFNFVLGFLTAVVLWGVHGLYRRVKAKRLQKKFDEHWAQEEPYVQ